MSKLAEFAAFINSALLIVIGMLVLKPEFLKQLLRWGVTPNLVTIVRWQITWIGFAVYFYRSPYFGTQLIVFGLMLDRLDGKLAALGTPCTPPFSEVRGWNRWKNQFVKELFWPGKTPTGEWLDPLIDKVVVLPLLAVLADWGYVSTPWLIVMACLEAVGTVMRPPVMLFPPDWVRVSASTGLGKLKVTAQILIFLMVLVVERRWAEDDLRWLPNAALAASTVLAGMSLLSRLHFQGRLARLNRLVDAFTNPFRH